MPTSFSRCALVLTAVALCGCGTAKTPAEPPVAPIRDLTPQETQVAARSASFGLRLLQEIVAAETTPNIMISPLSASAALGMALNGAHGQTFEDMRAVLGFASMSDEDINDAYQGLIAQLRARDPKVEFKLANSVWHERSFTVEKTFVEAVQQNFDAEIAGLDFLSPAAVSTINDWAARSTGNRIRQLIDRIDPLDRLFLINAVYFKAPWTQPFEPQATSPRPFVTLAGATVNPPMMMQDAAFRHFTSDGVQVVELLYADSAYSMVVVAPDRKETPLATLVQRLTPEQWEAWLGRLTPGRVMLFLPKFRFDYGVQLKQPLSDMGMEVAFQPRVADFRRINPAQDDLHISSVIQKSYIDVHELGTEAAAATAVTIGVTSMPPTLSFDHPFLFAIRERSTGTLLFVGRVGDPTR